MHLDELKRLSDILTSEEKRLLALHLLGAPSQEGPKKDAPANSGKKYSRDDVPGIEERLLKLRPKSVKAMRKSISCMYQFTEGISEAEIDDAVTAISSRGKIRTDGTKIKYSAAE